MKKFKKTLYARDPRAERERVRENPGVESGFFSGLFDI